MRSGETVEIMVIDFKKNRKEYGCGAARTARTLTALAAAVVSAVWWTSSAYAQSWTPPSGPSYTPPPSAPMPPPTPPPTSNMTVTIPVIPVLPTSVNTPFNILPKDLTSLSLDEVISPERGSGSAVGLLQMPIDTFPRPDAMKGSTEWILVRSKPGTNIAKSSDYSFDLKQGSIILSIRRPSQVAIVNTPMGSVSVEANGDVLVSYEEGGLRVMNLDGLGKNVKIKLTPSALSALVNGKQPAEPLKVEPLCFALAAGYEFLAADHTLSRAELRPPDGIARRAFVVLEKGACATCQFSLESVLTTTWLAGDIKQNVTGIKERRILSDMAKMAAVLNYVHGTQGYIASAQAR